MFKKSLVAVFLFLQAQILAEDLNQSRKLVSDLTNNHSKVLAQYDVFVQNLSDAHKTNKISEHGFQRIIKALNFAARKHQFQTRKDAELTPYIIHPIGVANNVLSIGKVYDVEIIMGALLHDTVEDTGTSFEEIKQNFGEIVEGYIREVTDDKSLEKEERKRLQIVNASHKSYGAAIVKLGDKIYNLTDLLHNSPPDWSAQRIKEYFEWAQQVINNLPKANLLLKNYVDEIIKTFNDSKILGR